MTTSEYACYILVFVTVSLNKLADLFFQIFSLQIGKPLVLKVYRQVELPIQQPAVEQERW